jgi:hypothetical protein
MAVAVGETRPRHWSAQREEHAMLAYRMTVAAAVSVGLLFGAAAIAPAAHATTLVNCLGTETLTFTPPLTNTSTPTQIHFAIDLDLCLTGGVISGDSAGSFQIPADCTSVSVLPPAFTDTYHWNTGATSAATYTAPVETTVNGSIVVTDTGTVTSGFDHGAVANETTTLPQPNLTACATTGVAQLNGPYTLTFG